MMFRVSTARCARPDTTVTQCSASARSAPVTCSALIQQGETLFSYMYTVHEMPPGTDPTKRDRVPSCLGPYNALRWSVQVRPCSACARKQALISDQARWDRSVVLSSKICSCDMIGPVLQRWASTLANRSNARHRSGLEVPLLVPRGGIPLSIHLSHATLCRLGLTVTGRAGSTTVCTTWRDSIVYLSVSWCSLPRRFDCNRKSGSATVCPTCRDSIVYPSDSCYSLPVYRLHTAILDRPPSSAATMEVQGPDTQWRGIQGVRSDRAFFLGRWWSPTAWMNFL